MAEENSVAIPGACHLRLSYPTEQSIFRHLDLDTRTWLRRKCKPRTVGKRAWISDIVAHDFDFVQVSSEDEATLIVEIDGAVWTFEDGKVTVEYNGKRGSATIKKEFVSEETSWKDDFVTFMQYYFNREQVTLIKALKSKCSEFPEMVVKLNCKLKCIDVTWLCDFNESFFKMMKHPFYSFAARNYQKEYSDMEVIQGAHCLSTFYMNTDALFSINKLNCRYISSYFVQTENLTRFLEELVMKPRPLGFRLQVGGDTAMLEKIVLNISRDAGWQRKQYRNKECISSERHGMEVKLTVSKNQLVVRYVECGTAGNKKSGMPFSCAHRIFRHLDFFKRDRLAHATEIYEWPYPKKVFLENLKVTCANGRIVETIVDGRKLKNEEYIDTLWYPERFFVKNLHIKEPFESRLSFISAENIFLESNEPIPKKFFDHFHNFDVPLKNLRATNKESLKYGGKLIELAETTTYDNEMDNEMDNEPPAKRVRLSD